MLTVSTSARSASKRESHHLVPHVVYIYFQSGCRCFRVLQRAVRARNNLRTCFGGVVPNNNCHPIIGNYSPIDVRGERLAHRIQSRLGGLVCDAQWEHERGKNKKNNTDAVHLLSRCDGANLKSASNRCARLCVIGQRSGRRRWLSRCNTHHITARN